MATRDEEDAGLRDLADGDTVQMESPGGNVTEVPARLVPNALRRGDHVKARAPSTPADIVPRTFDLSPGQALTGADVFLQPTGAVRVTITDAAKCREGIAAQGLPPKASYSAGQARPQVSSPTPIMIRRTSSSVRPSCEDHQGGAVGAKK